LTGELESSCFQDLINPDKKMPIIFEKDIDKFYDESELKLMKRGSGLFPAGHYPRKERSGRWIC
jgi:hypothetical protein